MINIRNAERILSSQVPTGRLLWVDQVNGVDKLAVRGRLTIPFKTLTAAADAAEPGDTIMVLPGEYHEDELFRNGVNWHFLPGATVVGPNLYGDLFHVTGADLMPFSVTGEGDFDAGIGHCALLVDHASANVTFQARTIKGVGASPVAVFDGTAIIDADSIFCGDIYAAVYAEGGETRLTACAARSTEGAGLHVAGGSVQAEIMEIACTDGAGVAVQDGVCLLRCMSIRTGSNAILMNGGTLHVEGAKIFSEVSGPSVSLSSDGLTLRNCWICSSGTASIGVASGSHSCRVFASAANVGLGVNTTDAIGGLAVDADVTD